MIKKKEMNASLYNRFLVVRNAEMRDLSITWFITWLCNYKCPFCWERIDDEVYRKSLMRTNQIKPGKWADVFNELNPGELYLTGGEPTLYKYLPEVIERLNKRIKLKITSNFGNSYDLEKYSPFVLDNRFSMMGFSFHPSECDIKDFCKKMDRALEMGYNEACDLGIEMVLYPDDLRFVSDMLDYCEEREVKLILDDYDDPRGEYKISPDILDITKEYHVRADDINGKNILKKIYNKKILSLNEVRLLPEVVLYGAGRAGRRLAEQLSEQERKHICCFADQQTNNKDETIYGKKVYKIEDAFRKFPNAIYVITVQKRDLLIDIGTCLQKCGIPSEKTRIYIESVKQEKKKCSRGKQDIWCPAGLLTLHVDPNGEVYPCMRAMTNIKQNDNSESSFRIQLGNILDGDEIIIDSPYRCKDSWRCSACDYQLMEDIMSDYI